MRNRLLLNALLVAALTGCVDSPEEPQAQSLFGLELPDLDGRLLPLIENDQRVRIINFWATWCAPCREEMPALQALDDMLDDRHYQVIGVTVDRDVNLVREFMLKYGISFAQRSDASMAVVSERLNVKVFPETFLVDRDGQVVKRVVGIRAWDDPTFIDTFLAPVTD